MSKKIYKRNLEWLMLLIIVAIIVKILQQSVLPPKYFYDSNNILGLMNGRGIADKSYMLTANIFNFINVFKLDTILQWSVSLGVIYNLVIFYILLTDNKMYTISQYIFIYASTALLNIYVFNLSKDIIQFTVFLLIYKILINKKISNFKKIIVISIILVIEALTYRMYYRNNGNAAGNNICNICIYDKREKNYKK